jgi:hypothetical protein
MTAHPARITSYLGALLPRCATLTISHNAGHTHVNSAFVQDHLKVKPDEGF